MHNKIINQLEEIYSQEVESMAGNLKMGCRAS